MLRASSTYVMIIAKDISTKAISSITIFALLDKIIVFLNKL